MRKKGVKGVRDAGKVVWKPRQRGSHGQQPQLGFEREKCWVRDMEEHNGEVTVADGRIGTC